MGEPKLPPPAVVFDLDDTLYAERDYVLSGMGAVAAWVEAELGSGADEAFAELVALFDQGVRGRVFDLWLQDQQLDLLGVIGKIKIEVLDSRHDQT